MFVVSGAPKLAVTYICIRNPQHHHLQEVPRTSNTVTVHCIEDG